MRLRKNEGFWDIIVRDVLSQHDRLSKTIDAIDRLAGAVERLSNVIEGLGPFEDSRYTTARNVSNDMVDERTMAILIGITQRTLGEHRRRGRLPGCWVKNRRRICWMPEQTLKAWERGIV